MQAVAQTPSWAWVAATLVCEMMGKLGLMYAEGPQQVGAHPLEQTVGLPD